MERLLAPTASSMKRTESQRQDKATKSSGQTRHGRQIRQTTSTRSRTTASARQTTSTRTTASARQTTRNLSPSFDGTSQTPEYAPVAESTPKKRTRLGEEKDSMQPEPADYSVAEYSVFAWQWELAEAMLDETIRAQTMDGIRQIVGAWKHLQRQKLSVVSAERRKAVTVAKERMQEIVGVLEEAFEHIVPTMEQCQVLDNALKDAIGQTLQVVSVEDSSLVGQEVTLCKSLKTLAKSIQEVLATSVGEMERAGVRKLAAAAEKRRRDELSAVETKKALNERLATLTDLVSECIGLCQ